MKQQQKLSCGRKYALQISVFCVSVCCICSTFFVALFQGSSSVSLCSMSVVAVGWFAVPHAVVLEHESLCRFPKGFSAFIHSHIFYFLATSTALVCCVSYVNCMHWSYCTALEQLLWLCGMSWVEISKIAMSCRLALVHHGVKSSLWSW